MYIDWRRGRDSNPRYGSPYNCLAGSPVQPLRHLSEGVGLWIDLIARSFRRNPVESRSAVEGNAPG